jgi:hypothetical protein
MALTTPSEWLNENLLDPTRQRFVRGDVTAYMRLYAAEQAVAFGTWYSGMDRQKVVNAHNKWKEEAK